MQYLMKNVFDILVLKLLGMLTLRAIFSIFILFIPKITLNNIRFSISKRQKDLISTQLNNLLECKFLATSGLISIGI